MVSFFTGTPFTNIQEKKYDPYSHIRCINHMAIYRQIYRYIDRWKDIQIDRYALYKSQAIYAKKQMLYQII